jgi:cupin 2 domain-containing protein
MNLFRNIPAELPEELCETLLDAEHVRIERIVSKGHCSPDGFWYDQSEHEWVILIKGHARFVIEGEYSVEMGPGDMCNIPAHQRHRVEWTDEEDETIWLAVFYK